jgi:cytosine/adenosine deaminase-related metal-dependent hydrolase
MNSTQATAIKISDSRIVADSKDTHDDLQLFFDEAIAIPGLINAHDHLDFNLFSQLGERLYSSYTEWGPYIHRHYKTEIDRIQAIPVKLRARWGAYKNLLCGVTTVVNHGQKLPLTEWPITVIDHLQSIHSIQFEKRWKIRLNNPVRQSRPVAIHVGEGTNEEANREIDQLLKWNLLNRRLIGIHGVAMNPIQAGQFCALVWCPESNFYLLGKTAAMNELKSCVPLLFGTDSTLTGHWDIWRHIRTAQATQMLNPAELHALLSTNAAKILQLNTGTLAPGYDADIVVARNSGISWVNTKPSDILLIVHKGNIRLFDESLYSQLPTQHRIGFSKVAINDTYKYVYGGLPQLMAAIKEYHPFVNFPVY